MKRVAISVQLLAGAATLAALGGCSTVRSGLGAYQAAADKGVTVGKPAAARTSPDATPAPPGSAISEVAPAAANDRGATASAAPAKKKVPLPGGLGGDTQHRAYSSGSPTG